MIKNDITLGLIQINTDINPIKIKADETKVIIEEMVKYVW
jgi:hypothetical protein